MYRPEQEEFKHVYDLYEKHPELINEELGGIAAVIDSVVPAPFFGEHQALELAASLSAWMRKRGFEKFFDYQGRPLRWARPDRTFNPLDQILEKNRRAWGRRKDNEDKHG